MKNDTVYIDHILKSINNILTYTYKQYMDDFAKNSLVQDAVIRNFEMNEQGIGPTVC